jgi:hypothetical protein
VRSLIFKWAWRSWSAIAALMRSLPTNITEQNQLRDCNCFYWMHV